MSSPQSPNEEVLRFALAQVQAGVRPFDVQRQRVAHGWEPQVAAQVMNRVRELSQLQPPNELPGGLSSAHASVGNSPDIRSAGQQASPTEKRKIPWGAYRDLVVGGIFLLVGALLGALNVSPVTGIFAFLFGVIQVIRGVVVAVLSQYRISQS